MPRVARSRQSPLEALVADLTNYVMLGKQVQFANGERGKVKRRLLSFLEDEEHHEVDSEKGHLVLNLDTPIVIDGVEYTGMMKQRKTSQVFLEDVAEELCRAKGFDPDEYTTRYVDQDKIVRLYAEDRITEEEFNGLTQVDESWAFVAVKR